MGSTPVFRNQGRCRGLLLLFVFRRAETRLHDALDREPTDEELAAELGMNPKRLRQYRQAAKAPVSLDARNR